LVNQKYISVRFDELRFKERNRELAILLEMSNFLGTSMDLDTLLTGALDKVTEYFEVEAGRIYLMDETARCLSLAAHKGLESRGLEVVHLNEGFSGKAARTKSFIAQHVSELEDKKRAALLAGKGLKIIICVPLIALDKVIGVMNLATSRMVRIDENKIDLLTTLGNQIAVAAVNARLYEDLEEKIKALENKKETIKFFAYSMSHDLKSPAVGIYGLVKRLVEKEGYLLNNRGKEYCNRILKTAQQMVALVENLNAYIAAKEAPLNRERINVKEITREIVDEFRLELRKRRIKWSEPEKLPNLVGDRLALLRVFRNLLDNALNYGGQDLQKITIGYHEDPQFHIISFSDDGVGVTADDADKVFNAFHRDRSARGISGSGLGLTIVKEIIERHQGRVWLEKGTRRGATFCMTISKALESNEHS